MQVTIHTRLSNLRVGDVFPWDGVDYVVDMINDCRARCSPLARKQVQYTTLRGDEVKFEADYASINISPNSEVNVTRRLGANWRQTYEKTKDKKVAAVA